MRSRELEKNVWKGGRAEVLEVKGEAEMSKEQSSSRGGTCGGAGGEEGRGIRNG